MSYQLSVLPSGLRIATEYLPGMETAAVAVTADVGARCETLQEAGLSHMLEHMAFKGTHTRTAQQIAEEMDMIGGQMNAYTSMENTVYYTRVLAPDMPRALEMLSDIVQHSICEAQELAREQDVILQEIAMHQDTPEDLVMDHFTEVAYPDQPLGRSILGTAEQVAGYRPEDVLGFMRKHYHAGSLIVSVAGRVEHDEVVRAVEQQFEALRSHALQAAPRARYTGGYRTTTRMQEQLHLMLGVEACTVLDEEYHAWQILAVILGGGMSSRLFQEVREKRGLVYGIQAFLSAFADTGVLGIYAATTPDKAEETLHVTCDELRRLQEGVREEELRRAKNQLKASLLMSRESTSTIAEWLGKHLLTYGRYRSATELAACIDAVSKDAVRTVAMQMLSRITQCSFAALGPACRVPDAEELRVRLS